MIKEAVATGVTIEEAQEAALAALGAPMSADIQFEVLTMPEKKKFGLFGGKLAEVRAYYECPDAPKKKPAAPKKNKAERKNDKPQERKASKKEAGGRKAAAAPKEKAAGKPNQKAASAPTPTKKAEKPIPEEISLDECPDPVKKAYAYLQEIVNGIGVDHVTVTVSHTEKEYFFTLSSEEDYSLLIGRRGETLDAIQYLVRLTANHGKEEGKFSKISINVGNYREKRENTLREIARKNGRRVRKYGRNVTLDPMNPFERRIIHTAIAEMDGLETYSVGSEAERRVVITLAEGVEPLQESSDYGRGRRDRGRGRGGDRRNGGNRTPKAETPAAPTRAPRADLEGVRYGKIEVRAAVPEESVPETAAMQPAADSMAAKTADVPETENKTEE